MLDHYHLRQKIGPSLGWVFHSRNPKEVEGLLQHCHQVDSDVGNSSHLKSRQS